MNLISDIDRIISKYDLEVILKCRNNIIKENSNDIYVQYYFDKEKYGKSVHYEIRYHKNNKKIYVEFHIEDEKLDKDPLMIKIKANLKKVPASNNKYWWGCLKYTTTEFDIDDLTGIKDAFEELVKKVESIKEETEQADN